MIDENALNIFTDGSCYYGPRRGGVGIVYVWVDSSGVEHSEPLERAGVPQGSIGRMELLAPTLALRNARPFLAKRRFSRILIQSDSQYLVKFCIVAINYWSKNQWRNKDGKPVANADQWKELLKTMREIRMQVNFAWVEGHAKDPYNKAADRLAKKSARSPLGKPASVVTVRRKKSRRLTDMKSVRMLGQRITIRIVTSEWLSVQRTNKYRYEVVSRSSPFHQAVSFLHSDLLLKPGHVYSVRLNTQDGNPGLQRLFREILPKVEDETARKST
jgi:ribonuclease HI